MIELINLSAELSRAEEERDTYRRQRDALVGALEEITESYDAGRCDGHPEPYPAHDADTMFGIALAALASVKEQQ